MLTDQADQYEYIGSELELFAKATHWKAYLRSQISPYLGAAVVEVGAGIGGTTQVLCDGRAQRWLGVEPDAKLADGYRAAVAQARVPACCELLVGTLSDVGADEQFDTVLYIDVLEHIEDDREELRRAAKVVRPGGFIVVLSPAHQWLFTPFDQAIGHFRRYSKQTLAAVAPPNAQIKRMVYLDSIGFFASLANRLLLKSAMPSAGQIAFWDKVLVRCSRVVDPALARTMGKSILAVWQKMPAT